MADLPIKNLYITKSAPNIMNDNQIETIRYLWIVKRFLNPKK